MSSMSIDRRLTDNFVNQPAAKNSKRITSKVMNVNAFMNQTVKNVQPFFLFYISYREKHAALKVINR